MTMKCTRCGQRSDWIGEGSEWQPLEGRRRPVALAMYECENCSHTQWIA